MEIETQNNVRTVPVKALASLAADILGPLTELLIESGPELPRHNSRNRLTRSGALGTPNIDAHLGYLLAGSTARSDQSRAVSDVAHRDGYREVGTHLHTNAPDHQPIGGF
ncbi:hypothetical protein IRT45_14105 [Nocardia sp. BSTN01]|uniref:hypothetical protein n=1 Tax=Nocardia sp. BSTN01 TaxID=2783665 RepID=UPI00188F21BF|nr:hypothetical protein [Nocardia sp. BSTN01]MBF4998286.1 hypothetical protein [Nocardia sp. BSTN01]